MVLRRAAYQYITYAAILGLCQSDNFDFLHCRRICSRLSWTLTGRWIARMCSAALSVRDHGAPCNILLSSEFDDRTAVRTQHHGELLIEDAMSGTSKLT